MSAVFFLFMPLILFNFYVQGFIMSVMPAAFGNGFVLVCFPRVKTRGYNVGHAYGIL
jgi:hypothetical protein